MLKQKFILNYRLIFYMGNFNNIHLNISMNRYHKLVYIQHLSYYMEQFHYMQGIFHQLDYHYNIKYINYILFLNSKDMMENNIQVLKQLYFLKKLLHLDQNYSQIENNQHLHYHWFKNLKFLLNMIKCHKILNNYMFQNRNCNNMFKYFRLIEI